MAETDRKGATLIDQALDSLGRAMAETDAAIALIRALPAAVEGRFKPASMPLQTRDEILAAHRRAHRGGTLSKIASDPELEAFIEARIDTHTYSELVGAVRSKFTADRQTSIAAVGRWAQKRRNRTATD
jgi:hypothetical protein